MFRDVEIARLLLTSAIDQFVRTDIISSTCMLAVRQMVEKQTPGGLTKHHAYDYGLLIHTSEVVENCIATMKSPALRVNTEVLIAAAVLHDWGKVYDYQRKVSSGLDLVGPFWEFTSHRKMIRHVSTSYAMFVSHVGITNIPIHPYQSIGHCILSHHNSYEWGSPVLPETVEARILAHSDALSAYHGVSCDTMVV